MPEKPEDLSLPLASVNRVINEALPDNVSVSQEARKVIAKTASVFVLYTAATAGQIAKDQGRKTMNANDVLKALVDEMQFKQFEAPLKTSLDGYREAQKKKKESSTAKKSEQALNKSASSKSSPKQGSKNETETVEVSESDGEGGED